MAGNGDIMDGIEPCRTCGIFYLTTSNFLRKFFDSSTDEYDLSNIRTELAAWSVQIIKDDGLPQYICTCCILEFQKMFKFRGLCVELQTQWRHFYNVRAENKLYIKKELTDPDEKSENICDFIYVDDISDNEYNGEGGGGFTPFKIPHVPIKEESADDAAGQNESIILGVKETFNTSSNQMETSEETNFAHNISYLTNSNSNSLDSPVSQLLDEPVNQLPPFEPNQEVSTSVQCSLCRHMSVSAELHRQHMKRIHEIKDLVCHICGKEFKNSTATRLKFHLKWHRISKHIKCAQCGFFCDSRATLKEHTRAIHSKIECTTCGKRVLGKKMKIHMRGHKLRSWSCSYCDEVFQTENVLEAHIWQIHAQEENLSIATEDNNTRNKLAEQSSSCSQCNQFYTTQYELNAHKLQCHLMPNTFDTESYASSDLQSEQFHYQDPADILQVPTTNLPNTNKGTGVNEGNSYTSCNNDAVTQIISSDEETCDSDSYSAASKDFACPKCTQTFSSTEQLCTHYQQHVEKSGFNCQICGKSFELKFSLNRHLKKHNSQ